MEISHSIKPNSILKLNAVLAGKSGLKFKWRVQGNRFFPLVVGSWPNALELNLSALIRKSVFHFLPQARLSDFMAKNRWLSVPKPWLVLLRISGSLDICLKMNVFLYLDIFDNQWTRSCFEWRGTISLCVFTLVSWIFPTHLLRSGFPSASSLPLIVACKVRPCCLSIPNLEKIP